MERFRSWIPHGFEFYPPKTTKELRALQQTVRSSFESAGCEEVIPPLMDFGATFELTSSSHASERAFESRDSRGDLLAVRSDLTVQIIKAVASGRLPGTNGSEIRKYYYLQPVFIDHPQGTGRIREVFQAGTEWIETNEPGRQNDAERVTELISLAIGTLSEEIDLLKRNPVRILYSDVRYLDRILDNYRERLLGSHLLEIKKAYYDKNTDLLESLAKQHRLSDQDREILTTTPLLFGSAEVLTELKDLCKGREELTGLIDTAAKIRPVQYDFSIVRELSYYSGPVFEGYSTGSNEKIVSGGVYDKLATPFGMDLKAAGFAINLTAILQAGQRERSIS